MLVVPQHKKRYHYLIASTVQGSCLWLGIFTSWVLVREPLVQKSNHDDNLLATFIWTTCFILCCIVVKIIINSNFKVLSSHQLICLSVNPPASMHGET